MTEFVAGFFANPEAARATANELGGPTENSQAPNCQRSTLIGNAWVRSANETILTKRDDGRLLFCSNARSAKQLNAHTNPMAAEGLSSAIDSFAALLVGNDGHWHAATDRFASRPLYTARSRDGSLWLATDLRLLLSIPGINLALDEQAIYNFVHFHVIPGPRSVFKGVQKLGAASLISGYGADSVANQKYWPQSQTDISFNHETMKADVARELHGAVDRLVGDGPSACFLSGGLDSSTIAGSLARHGTTHAFTIGFDEPGYDEMDYAKLAAEHFGIEHHTLYIRPADVETLLPDVATRIGEPFGNMSAIPAYACATMAHEAGFGAMFAGDGGDEFFAGNERYARHQLISHWQRLPSWLRRSLEPALVKLVGNRVSVLHKVGRYVDIAKDDLPVRLREDFEHFQGFAPEEIFSERFMAHVDRENPLHLLRTIVEESEGRDLLETLLQVDWRLTLTDNDLRKVHYACKAANVTAVYPMLDPAFVALSRRIPSSEKLKPTRLRAIFKDAFSDFLPERIINKPKHGFGLPFGEWLRSDPGLRAMCDEQLNNAVSRGLVNQPFVEKLVNAHRETHAAYFGTMIGALLMLELWLSATQDQVALH